MYFAFIVDDDEYAVEATYMMFNWQDLNISRIEKRALIQLSKAFYQ